MKIEFLVKSPDFQRLREQEEEEHGEGYEESLDLNKLLTGEGLKKIPITYRPYAIEMKDILTFGKEDDQHVDLRTSSGAFSIKIDYDVFKQIYTTATGDGVRSLRDFKIVRE